MYIRILATLLVAATTLGLSACNTIAGFGQDITDSARTVQHAL
ncbi:putative small secreted protein [Paraburkholderia tropica]|jgi:predicted small secreted protein|nr:MULTISPECIES: hypothetical protein [Paraburkholderia]MBB3002641.1 putative small secreted protein [Paraburkholderia tropica]MBB6322002.1 putative small secreted protein [Paraburkholderia tropica]